MIYCDVVNCRYNNERQCYGPQRAKLVQQYNEGYPVRMMMACADFTALSE